MISGWLKRWQNQRIFKWCNPSGLLEVISHTAEKMATEISNQLTRINSIQHSCSIHITQIYEFRSITYDLTSSNTGRLGGLHVKLENLHKEAWDKDNKLAGKIPAWFKGRCKSRGK